MTAGERLAALEGRIFATVADVAPIIEIDERTLRRACAAGEFPHVRIGATIRIRVADLRRLAGLEDGEAGPDEPGIRTQEDPPHVRRESQDHASG